MRPKIPLTKTFIIAASLAFLCAFPSSALEIPQNIKEIYALLQDIPPGSSKEKVLEHLGNPRDRENPHDSQNEVWMWGETQTDRMVTVSFSDNLVEIAAYFEFFYTYSSETEKEINAKYHSYRTDLLNFLGNPMMESSGFMSAWRVEGNLLYLMKLFDAEGATVAGVGISLQKQKI
jgi:outer membrane protein assembly factor BamE (lipoprotein component of BamABCDE complex)